MPSRNRHWSWVTLKTGGDLPGWQIPVFLVNAAFMGAVWGLLRAISGSVIVASLSHGVWNGIAYVFFGVGTKAVRSASRTPRSSGRRSASSGSRLTPCLRWRSGDGAECVT